MKVVIGGCGQVGACLANRLSMEGHDVAVIDKDPTAFERLAKAFRGTTIRGSVFDGEVLEKAGVEHADAFASVTGSDNSNIASATTAKDVYRVPKAIAQIYEPGRAEICRRLGVFTVSIVTWASNEILTLMLRTDIAREAIFGDGEVQLARIPIQRTLVGRTVDDISIPEEILVVAIVRGGKSLIPGGSFVFQEHDLAEVAVLSKAWPKLRRMLAPQGASK